MQNKHYLIELLEEVKAKNNTKPQLLTKQLFQKSLKDRMNSLRDSLNRTKGILDKVVTPKVPDVTANKHLS